MSTPGLVERLRNGGQPDLAQQADAVCKQVARLAFLLNSTRLIIADPAACEMARQAVDEARRTLEAVGSKPWESVHE